MNCLFLPLFGFERFVNLLIIVQTGLEAYPTGWLSELSGNRVESNFCIIIVLRIIPRTYQRKGGGVMLQSGSNPSHGFSFLTFCYDVANSLTDLLTGLQTILKAFRNCSVKEEMAHV